MDKPTVTRGMKAVTTEPLGAMLRGDEVIIPAGTDVVVLGENDRKPGHWDLETSDQAGIPFAHPEQFRIVGPA